MSLQTFTDAYIACALWSSSDDQDGPLDESGADLAPEAKARMESDCKAFYGIAQSLLDELGDEPGGRDFWLTRNGHGAGFWDGD